MVTGDLWGQASGLFLSHDDHLDPMYWNSCCPVRQFRANLFFIIFPSKPFHTTLTSSNCCFSSLFLPWSCLAVVQNLNNKTHCRRETFRIHIFYLFHTTATKEAFFISIAVLTTVTEAICECSTLSVHQALPSVGHEWKNFSKRGNLKESN